LRLSMAMKCSLGVTRTLNDLSLRDTAGCTRSPSWILGETLDKSPQSA
jgi:hypothetical protein